MIANTPKPPYYAVIFTSIKTGADNNYVQMAFKMVELAKQQEGFLGVESARNQLGITVSYWENEEAIKKWKLNIEHKEAQLNGKAIWYKKFKVRVCKIERDYDFEK